MIDYARLAIALAIAAACFGTGWTIQGWHKDSDIAALKLQQSNDRATVAEKALTDLQAGTKKMNEAATELTGIKLNLDGKLDKISKDLKNAQAQKPLPDNCKPDDLRMLNLKAAIDAANSAAFGQ